MHIRLTFPDKSMNRMPSRQKLFIETKKYWDRDYLKLGIELGAGMHMANSCSLRRLVLIIVLALLLVGSFGLSRYSPLSEASPSESTSLLIVADESTISDGKPFDEKP